MSVLCCTIPDFAVGLVCRSQPALAGQPLALLGADERVCALSPAARVAGVRMAMRPRQAQTHCPDVRLLPVDVTACQAEQAVLLGLLADWGLPVEELGWGAAYVDLHSVAVAAQQVEPLAVQLGRQVREALGGALQPALGWDSGKFTARAAALCAPAGRIRLVEKAAERPFLTPLPITLLPLPLPALQQLHWLGIRTLGAFAALPTTAVQQRFGAAGRQAQLWAKGQDRRPVRPTVQAAPEPIPVDFDPPTANLSQVVAAALAALRPLLQGLAERLEGCRRLRVALHFADGDSRTLELTWVEPVSQPATLQPHLRQQLQQTSWPAALARMRLSLLAVGELATQQLTLFARPDAGRTTLAALAQPLVERYGPLFWRAEQCEPTHPIPARRFALHALV